MPGPNGLELMMGDWRLHGPALGHDFHRQREERGHLGHSPAGRWWATTSSRCVWAAMTGAVYTIDIARAAPEVELRVSIDGNGDGDFGDAEDRSATTTAATYSDNTIYAESSAQIQVMVNRPAMPDALSVSVNGAALSWDATDPNMAVSDALSLNVGANEFEVRVGDAVHTVTLTRGEGLSPEISFTLLEADDTVLGGGDTSFMLDASSRQYDFITETGLDADILLTAAKVQICVADPDGDDVKVSIEDVDVPLCSTEHASRA